MKAHSRVITIGYGLFLRFNIQDQRDYVNI